MKKINWQRLFEEHILERGYLYYQQDLVKDFEHDDDYIQAIVRGSEEYEVYIDIDGDEILDMNCSCPYAAEGNNCKHMAAVLYQLDGGKPTIKAESAVSVKPGKLRTSKKSDKKPSVAELVKQADSKLVLTFLTGILESDERLLSRFKTALHCDISAADLNRYKDQIRSIFRSHSGRHGFIDYNDAGAFISNLDEFLNHDIRGLIDNDQLEAAFNLTCFLFVEVGRQDMDDSDGGTGTISESCSNIWQEILRKCELKMKRTMFQWFLDHFNGLVVDYMEEYMEEIFFSEFQEMEFLEQKLKFTENRTKTESRGVSDWQRNYENGRWAVRHMEVMKAMGMSDTQIERYCSDNLQFNKVRDYLVTLFMRQERLAEAIRLLEAGKIVEKSSPGLVSNYSMQLIDLYQKTGDHKAYADELMVYFIQHKPGDLKAFKKLKTLFTHEEWPAKREELFRRLPRNAQIDRLYDEEKLYEQLLKLMLTSSGLHQLITYEKSLKPLYPTELFAKYESEVQAMVARASNRSRYQEIVTILRRMKEYPDGRSKVAAIVDSWLIKYHNRPAMRDELLNL